MTLGISPPLLAQTVAFGDQLTIFLDRLLTPGGLVVFTLGVGLVLAISASSRGFVAITGTVMFLLAMMGFGITDQGRDTTLIAPLQAIRSVSRPVSLALLIVMTAKAVTIDPGRRNTFAGSGAMSLLALQLLYIAEIGMFSDPGKGIFGALSILTMFFVYAFGYGRVMRTPEDTERLFKIFAWLGLAFIGTNLIQIGLNLNNALLGGRLSGISGNPQYMAAVTTYLLLFNAFLFLCGGLSALTRIVVVCNLGVLAAFILWTGSRTGALALGIGLIAMFRLKVGRLALLACAGGLITYFVLGLFVETEEAVGRLIEGRNTRAAVFAQAIDDFLDAPLFGQLPIAKSVLGTQVREVESTLLRALSNMGILGGLFAIPPFVFIFRYGLVAIRLARCDDSRIRRLADLYIGLAAAILVVNTFEAFAFGVLTFNVLVMYLHLSFGRALVDFDSDIERNSTESGEHI